MPFFSLQGVRDAKSISYLLSYFVDPEKNLLIKEIITTNISHMYLKRILKHLQESGIFG